MIRISNYSESNKSPNLLRANRIRRGKQSQPKKGGTQQARLSKQDASGMAPLASAIKNGMCANHTPHARKAQTNRYRPRVWLGHPGAPTSRARFNTAATTFPQNVIPSNARRTAFSFFLFLGGGETYSRADQPQNQDFSPEKAWKAFREAFSRRRKNAGPQNHFVIRTRTDFSTVNVLPTASPHRLARDLLPHTRPRVSPEASWPLPE